MRADEKQGVGAVLLTSDTATGEAIAYACARRGLNVRVAGAGRVDTSGAEVVLVDLRGHGATSLRDLTGMCGDGPCRVVAIGEAPAGNAEADIAARVSLDAGLDDLIAVVAGTERTRPRPGVAARNDLDRLTSREREVMELLLAGLGAEAIGARLGIAVSTVRTHLQNVFAKLGVSSRAEAAAWALRAGLEPADVAP
jgi:DNA-binding CsgD family transcriptional regulator